MDDDGAPVFEGTTPAVEQEFKEEVKAEPASPAVPAYQPHPSRAVAPHNKTVVGPPPGPPPGLPPSFNIRSEQQQSGKQAGVKRPIQQVGIIHFHP